MDALQLLSEAATKSPRSRALASLNMTQEELEQHTRSMRSFLAGDASSISSTSTSSSTATTSSTSPLGPVTPSGRTTRARTQAAAAAAAATTTPVTRSKTVVSPKKTASPAAAMAVLDLHSPAQSTPRPAQTKAQRTPGPPRFNLKKERDPTRIDKITATQSAAPRRIAPLPTSTPGSSGSRASPYPLPHISSTPARASTASLPNTISPKTPSSSRGAPASVPVTSPTPSSPHPDNPNETLPFTVPEGPRPDTKPTYSYAALIGQAILASTHKRLSLNEIYIYISMAYPYYRRDQPGWRNSIRHNLSLNGSFVKIQRHPNEKGKGSLWAIKEEDLDLFPDGNYFRRNSGPGSRKRKNKSEEEDPDASATDEPESGTKRRKSSVSSSSSSAPVISCSSSSDDIGGLLSQLMYYTQTPANDFQGSLATPNTSSIYSTSTLPRSSITTSASSSFGSTPGHTPSFLTSSFSTSAITGKSNVVSSFPSFFLPTNFLNSQLAAQLSQPARPASQQPQPQHEPKSAPDSSPLPSSSPLPGSSPLPPSSPILPPSSPPSPFSSPSEFLHDLSDLESDDEALPPLALTRPSTPDGRFSSPFLPSSPSDERVARSAKGNRRLPSVLSTRPIESLGSQNTRAKGSSPSLELNIELTVKKAKQKQPDSPGNPFIQPPRSSSPSSPTLSSRAARRHTKPASAQDIMALALEASSSMSSPRKSPPKSDGRVTTPIGWKTSASLDVVLNPHKAPVSPFARPTTPPPRRTPGSHGKMSFITPPPKNKATRTYDSLSSSSDSASGSAQKNSLAQSPSPSRLFSDFGYSDDFGSGLSPSRTPLSHRALFMSPNATSDLADYKRSLLPPSPFRTPTSSARRNDADPIFGSDMDDLYDPAALALPRLSPRGPTTPVRSTSVLGSSSLFGPLKTESTSGSGSKSEDTRSRLAWDDSPEWKGLFG